MHAKQVLKLWGYRAGPFGYHLLNFMALIAAAGFCLVSAVFWLDLIIYWERIFYAGMLVHHLVSELPKLFVSQEVFLLIVRK